MNEDKVIYKGITLEWKPYWNGNHYWCQIDSEGNTIAVYKFLDYAKENIDKRRRNYEISN